MTRTVLKIAALEARLMWRRRLALASIVAFTLIAATVVVLGISRHQRDVRDRDLLSRASRDAGSRGVAHQALERGTFAVLPPGPLTSLAVGQSDVHPGHYRITARLPDAQLTGSQLEHPLASLTGSLDLSFVVLFLLPLVVVGISHDIVASDRASGMLGLLLVQGATVREIVAGRVAAHALLIGTLGIGATATAVALVDPGHVFGTRFVWWTVTIAAYMVFWLGLAVHVNAGRRSAAANATRLAVAWLAFAVLVPSAVNTGVRLIHPVPSRVALATALRDATRGAIAQGSRTLGRFLEDHPSTGTGEEGMRQYYALQDARDSEMARLVQPLLSAFDEQVERQAVAMSLAQYLSPTVVGHLALTDIAGTSSHRARRFADQAAAFQRTWKAHFPADVLASDRPTAVPAPGFVFVEEPASTMVGRTALPVAVLLAGSLALLGAGIWRAGFIDVTPE
jgi:ABC-2 type transport system permease protein